MGYIIRMPQLGMSMDEGTVVEWAVDEGEAVTEGNVVVVVESEKASKEVEAREDGMVGRILVPERRTVEPGDSIGIVTGPDEDVAEYVDRIDESLTDVDPRLSDSSESSSSSPKASNGVNGTQKSTGKEDVRASPGAKRRAQDEGIDLAEVQGTGPKGVVTEEDIENYLTEDRGDGSVSRTVVDTRELTAVQRTIGDRLEKSYREAVHVTLNRSFDGNALDDVLTMARSRDIEASMTDLLLKASGRTLKEHPEFNAVYEDGEHRLIDEVNVGSAVDVEDGLFTPVIPSVDEKSVEAVHSERMARIERIRSGAFDTDDLSGGTFTVSNLGPYGVDAFDPVINPPEIAILGVGRMRDSGLMTLCLSFDHRVVNGADAARFLETLVASVTNASTLAEFFAAELPLESGSANESRAITVESPRGLSGQYRTPAGDVGFDEPVDVGGDGSAPSPVDHFLGAIGSCLTISVKVIARRGSLDIDDVTADVSGSPPTGPIDEIDIVLEIGSDASDADVDAVVTKAERACYVSRALGSDLDVSISWRRV